MIRQRIFWPLFLIGLLLAAGGILLGLLRNSRGLPEAVVLAPDLYAAALAACCLWLRAPLAPGRECTFWRLWAAGFALWVVNDALLVRFTRGPISSGVAHAALAFTYVPHVVMMAALVLQPEVVAGELRDPVVRYEAALVALCWLYLYLLLVIPWSIASPDEARYWAAFLRLHDLQNALLVLWLGVLGSLAVGLWRRIYLHMCAAAVLLALVIGPLHSTFAAGRTASAMTFEALLAFSFLWVAWAGATLRPSANDVPTPSRSPSLGSGSWLSAFAAFGVPLLAAWFSFHDHAPSPVRQFRFFVSLFIIVGAIVLVYRRESVADRQCERFLSDLGASLADVRRLQGQFAEAEKLASLGLLAAGAAHEINNPVAAILGYSELIRADASASRRVLDMASRIGDQSRRIRSLVHDLLSLADHHPLNLHNVDAAALLQSAVDLRRIAAERNRGHLRVDFDARPLAVRGDADKLLQAFYGLLTALADSAGDGPSELTVRASRHDDRVILQFLQTAPNLADSTALDTAQKAANGIGLSLAVCQSIVREHGGSLTAGTTPEGGRMFQVDLPSIAGEPFPVA